MRFPIVVGVLFLALLPLPDALSAIRPAIYPATVLFWVLMQPASFGLLAAWACGILIDVIYGTPLGEHGEAPVMAAARLRDDAVRHLFLERKKSTQKYTKPYKNQKLHCCF